MNKTAVVYWSGSGNTQAMAEAVADGAKAAGAEVTVFEVSDFSAEKVDAYDTIAFGCPAMGDEELEDTVFQPVFEDCKEKLAGKAIGLFGSYGWGDGEWMRKWEEECKEASAVLAIPPVLANDAPDDDAVAACKALGKALA
jgi:flavodoxin short chain